MPTVSRGTAHTSRIIALPRLTVEKLEPAFVVYQVGA